MDLPRALAQIGEIHALIGRAGVYSGYRSLPIAASGVIGLLAAAWRPAPLATAPGEFVGYWTTVASAAGFIGISQVLFNYFTREDTVARRRTHQAVGQFVPCVIVGAVLTLAFTRFGLGPAALLPALWALCFGLGIFASLPFLPRAGGWIGAYYLAAGAALLWASNDPAQITGWHVGGLFGVGQLLSAAVLYFRVERTDDVDGEAL